MGNICPSAVSHINSAEDNLHTFSKLWPYNSIKWPPAGGRVGGGTGSASPVKTDHWGLRPQQERQATAGERTDKRQRWCLQSHWGSETVSVNARAVLFALMRRRKEEEFVFPAMYRREWCLWHSSCSRETGDTLTFSQLSWWAASTQGWEGAQTCCGENRNLAESHFAHWLTATTRWTST